MTDTTVGVSNQTHKALRRRQLDQADEYNKPSLDQIIYDLIPDQYKKED